MKTENKSREVEEFAAIECPKCSKVNICQISIEEKSCKISIDEKLSFYTGSFSCTVCKEMINVIWANCCGSWKVLRC